MSSIITVSCASSSCFQVAEVSEGCLVIDSRSPSPAAAPAPAPPVTAGAESSSEKKIKETNKVRSDKKEIIVTENKKEG